MAIALDTSTNGGSALAATSLTFSHTCTGSNLILFVGAKTTTAVDVVTGITYAGDPMTRITAAQPGTGYTYLYYKIAPATGTNSVVISSSASVDIYGVAASYTGAQQSGVPDSSNSLTSDPATSISQSTTVVATNCWVVSIGGLKDGSTATLSLGSGGVSRQINSLVGIADTNTTVGTGAYTMAWNASSSTGMSIILASFAPAPAVEAAAAGYSFII